MKKCRVKTALRIVLVVALALLILCALPILSRLTVVEILTFTPDRPLLALCVLLGLYSLKSTVCAIPMTLLYISAGIMFPPAWAIAATYAGLVCEMTAGYLIGRSMGREWILSYADKHPKAAALLDKITHNTSVVCFTVRLIPGPLPFDVMSWLFGASGMGFGGYLFYSLLGVSPAMLPWVLAGNSILSPLSRRFLTPFLTCAVIGLALLFFLRRLERRRTAGS